MVMRPWKTMACGALLAWTAGAGASAQQDPEDEEVKVRKVPFVEVLRPEQKPLRGFPLPSQDATTQVLLIGVAEGRLHALAWEDIKDFQVLTERSVKEVPSKALVEGMGLDDTVARDECYARLADQEWDPTDELLAGTTHKNPEVRWRCLDLLSRMDTSKWAARLKRLLKDEDVRVRRLALTAYSKAKTEDLVDVAGRMLRREEDLKIRHDIILIIGYSKDAHGVDDLLEHLETTDNRSLLLVTYASLRRLTGMNFGKKPDAWKSWWTNHRDEVLLEQERRKSEARF